MLDSISCRSDQFCKLIVSWKLICGSFYFSVKMGESIIKRLMKVAFFFFFQNIVRFIKEVKEVDLKSVSLSLQSVWSLYISVCVCWQDVLCVCVRKGEACCVLRGRVPRGQQVATETGCVPEDRYFHGNGAWA